MSFANDRLSQGSARASSIARSIGWGNWWRRLLRWLLFDLLLAAIALFIFACTCNDTLPASLMASGSIFPNCPFGLFGDGMSVSTWRYEVMAPGRTYTFPLLDAIEPIWPIPAFILLWQLIDLFGVFGEIRRVRRKLQPLNDLAIMADALSQAGVVDPMSLSAASGVDKMATLEQAIARASVDSPTVSTGEDGVPQDALLVEFGERGMSTAFSAYVAYRRGDTPDDLAVSEPLAGRTKQRRKSWTQYSLSVL